MCSPVLRSVMIFPSFEKGAGTATKGATTRFPKVPKTPYRFLITFHHASTDDLDSGRTFERLGECPFDERYKREVAPRAQSHPERRIVVYGCHDGQLARFYEVRRNRDGGTMHDDPDTACSMFLSDLPNLFGKSPG